MPNESLHIDEGELLLAADGELSPRKMAQIRKHLASCWPCRTRLREIEGAIVDFVHIHNRTLNPQLPSIGGPRVLLQARLAELSAASPRSPWQWLRETAVSWRGLAYACASLAVAAAIVTMVSRQPAAPPPKLSQAGNGTFPDPWLTPGAVLPVSEQELCSLGGGEQDPSVPPPVALKVFAAYGITQPRPRAYELDFLISPELGGSSDARNLWPQAYQTPVWNAHAKDALEEHLFQLVCHGNLDLATAQRDIATDWISAYKKYFDTDRPLSAHAAFLKDRPWE